MAHVVHSRDGIWLGKAYVRYLITNSLTCHGHFKDPNPIDIIHIKDTTETMTSASQASSQNIRGKIDKDNTEHVAPGMRSASPVILASIK